MTSVHITDLAKWCAISFGSRDANPLSIAHNLYLKNEKVAELVIPNGVTSIRKYAFSGCSSLTSVTILDEVKRIEEYAFKDCVNLVDVLISSGSSCEFFMGAFDGCVNLKRIRFLDRKTGVVKSVALDDIKYCGNCGYSSHDDGWWPDPDWREESGWNDVYGRGVEASDIIDFGD